MHREPILRQAPASTARESRKWHPVSELAAETAGPRLVELPTFVDERGSVSVIEWEGVLPFQPRRLYYLHHLAHGTRRGGHAHWIDQEVILALSGRFIVATDDGSSRREHLLDQPNIGLHIPSLIWHQLHSFSAGAVCAVLASEPYNEQDYIRDYDRFLKDSRKRRQ